MTDDEYLSSDASEEEYYFSGSETEGENEEEKEDVEGGSDIEEDDEDIPKKKKERGVKLDSSTYSSVYVLTEYEVVEIIRHRAELINQGYKTKLSEEERGGTYKSEDIALKEYNRKKLPKCLVIREMPNGDYLELEFPKDFKYSPVYADP